MIPGFAWDAGKAAGNLRKHGVTFREAATVFDDEHGLLIEDPDHSGPGDPRQILLGTSRLLRTLVVVHQYRPPDDTIRIISARAATRHERRQYEAHRNAS